MFEVGDRIVCIKNDDNYNLYDLPLGKVYTIVSPIEQNCICLKEHTGFIFWGLWKIDTFVTELEYRKIKILKIKEIINGITIS